MPYLDLAVVVMLRPVYPELVIFPNLVLPFRPSLAFNVRALIIIFAHARL